MNVWIINHYASPPIYYDGFRHYKMAQNLISKGHSVHIFTASTIHTTGDNLIGKGNTNLFLNETYEGINYTLIKTPSYAGNGLKRIRNMLGFSKKIKKLWKEYGKENPDIIYVSSPHIFSARSAEKFAKRHNIPCIVEVRDLWPLSIVEYKGISNTNPIIRFLYKLERKIYKEADAIIFTMEGGKDYIKDKKWKDAVSFNKIFHINNGLDLSAQEQQRNEDVLLDDDLTDECFKVIYAGSIRTVNAIDMLVKAFELLKDHSDIKLILYGEGEDKQKIAQYCVDNNLTNVIFKGHVNSKFIPYICSCADINIISVKMTGVSKYGVSWNKLFDYMNAGKPILSTVSVNYDLLKKYNCGISLSDQSPQSIADAILRFYDMPREEYDQMCANAKDAAKNYDYSKLTDKLEEVIEYAIEHHGEKNNAIH